MSEKRAVKCWGCELGVPLVGEMHREDTDIPGTVYVYPCADDVRAGRASAESTRSSKEKP